MKIPIALTKAADRQPATALLLPTPSAAELFALIERLGLDRLPMVYGTAEGFLLRLPAPREAAIAGVIRLRSLAPNLFLPLDAELTPPLLADEALGLTRQRGLVFLPGKKVLEFAADQPLAWDQLVHVPSIVPSRWRALPEPTALANELIELKSVAPPILPDAILEQGRADIGTESPRPEPAAGIGTQILGTTLFVTGHTMAWLGTKLGLAGIAGKGADMLQRALDRVPRLSEFLMNQQEAMLRRLLKDFREGKIEEALRRALPLGGPNSQPMTLASNAQLPRHNLIHSLQNLLGGRNLPGGAWFSPDDLFYSLQAEYRKQAEAAARAGDFRRAAFIYAKLLNDLSGAARILAQGGLHRDAAVLYEDVLNNPRAAAQEWEAAGEFDKAVEILVGRLRDPLAAAELLAKVGETERALKYYCLAAERLVFDKKHFEAGELLRTKAKRLDLALKVYADGWNLRPMTSAVACGLFLATHYTEAPNLVRFRQVVREASACVLDWTDVTVVHFFNHICRLARRSALVDIADHVLDECLMSLAKSMAEYDATTKTGHIFFPADSPWAAPVARDGLFARERLARRPLPESDFKLLTRLGHSTVRAVCHMPLSGDLFLGFENGEILHHRPVNGETRTIAARSSPILGLLSDAEERHLIALVQSRTGAGYVLVGSRSTNFGMIEFLQTPADRAPRLMSRFDNQPSPFFGVISGDEVMFLRSDNPSWRQTTTPILGCRPLTGIVGSTPDSGAVPFAMVFYESSAAIVGGKPASTPYPYHYFDGDHRFDANATPWHPERNTLYQSPVIGQFDSAAHVSIQWITQSGAVYTTTLQLADLKLDWPPHRILTATAALGIHGSSGRCPISAGDLSLWDRLDERTKRQGNPVAAFAQGTSGILLIDANGTLTRAMAAGASKR